MGKSDVGEGKITSARVFCTPGGSIIHTASHHHRLDLLAPTKEFMFQT